MTLNLPVQARPGTSPVGLYEREPPPRPSPVALQRRGRFRLGSGQLGRGSLGGVVVSPASAAQTSALSRATLVAEEGILLLHGHVNTLAVGPRNRVEREALAAPPRWGRVPPCRPTRARLVRLLSAIPATNPKRRSCVRGRLHAPEGVRVRAIDPFLGSLRPLPTGFECGESTRQCRGRDPEGRRHSNPALWSSLNLFPRGVCHRIISLGRLHSPRLQVHLRRLPQARLRAIVETTLHRAPLTGFRQPPV